MPNFFIKKAQIEKGQIRITGELLNHLRDSLRIQKGEKFVCVDEDSNKYIVEVSSVSKALLIGDVIEKTGIEKIPAVYIHLIQAIPKGPKLDFIIQKSTELGVNAITPVISERSVVRIEKERVKDKSERWKRIALEAAQQSNRMDVPDVALPVTLRDFLSSFIKADLNLLLLEGEQRSGIRDLRHRVQDVKNITLLIGPEGGFSESEVRMAIEKGFIPVSLGELILRTETAPVVALSILQYEFGNMG